MKKYTAKTMAGHQITCTDLRKSFAVNGAQIEAVDRTNVMFAAGQTTALVGQSGCGKSTLLRMIAGLEAPTDGAIMIGDETPAQLAKRGALSMAFQEASLLPWKSVRSNIALGLKLARQPKDPVAIQTLIDLVGLSGFEDARPAALSGGMRQRAAIARCLISNPELVLLDEPFGAVDAITRHRLNIELPPLWRDRGTTALLVTHSVTEAILLADRVLVLSPRPAKIVADIKITLADRDPRALAFKAMSDQVTDALQGVAA